MILAFVKRVTPATISGMKVAEDTRPYAEP